MAERHSEYDQIREHIVQRIVEITASYGQGRVRQEGSRVIFRCPTCNKDKLTANPDWHGGPITGCWNYECSIPNTMNAVDFIAHMEGLDPRSQYKMVLDQGSRITAAPLLEAKQRLAQKKNSKQTKNIKLNLNTDENSSSILNQSQDQNHGHDSGQTSEADPVLTDTVYRRLITSCGLPPKAWEGLKNRGLTKQTVLDAGTGYISADKAQTIMHSLHGEFGDDLGRVPGFYPAERSATGYWSNFAGKDLILFPYHDSKGLISTVEGRIMFGKENTAKYKYLSLTGSGSHLYVYPGMGFENIEAFCEGIFGAILAAQEGICVASIQGFRRYRASGGRYPLPELQGTDFAGRTIPYIPDMDSPPNPEVADAAPDAARWLIERQGGQPIIALMTAGKDLDEYLMMIETPKRRRAFEKLIELGSYTLEDYSDRIAAEGASRAKKADEVKPVDQAEQLQHTGEPDNSPNHNVQGGHRGDQSLERQQDHSEDDEDPPDHSRNQSETDDGAGNRNTGDHTNNAGHVDAQGQLNDSDRNPHDQQDHDEPDRQQDTEQDGQGTEGDPGKENEILGEFAPASQLTGEQFYRNDLSFPEEPPDPKLALAGRNGRLTDEDDSEDKEPWHERLRAYLTQGALAIIKSTARTAFKLATVFVALYITLVLLFALLIPGGAFEGMWKWLTLTIVICVLFRSRIRSRTNRMKRGTLSPGAKS